MENWRSDLEEQEEWFFFFYLLILKQENILFETHLAKWGKTTSPNRITNLMSKALNLGFDFTLKWQYTHARSVGDKQESEICARLHSSAFLEAEDTALWWKDTGLICKT